MLWKADWFWWSFCFYKYEWIRTRPIHESLMVMKYKRTAYKQASRDRFLLLKIWIGHAFQLWVVWILGLCLSYISTPGQGGKIIISMPGAPLLVPYQAYRTTSTEPAYRHLIYMLNGPYSLFRNQLIGNEDYYWLLVKSLFSFISSW